MVGGTELSVAGFVRDAQMASSLSSASRWLVSDADFATIAADGNLAQHEIIAEFLLHDPARTSTVQLDYETTPNLPTNGPAVTYRMIQFINVISDGLAALVLILVSLLLIAVALVSVRFVIRNTLLDEAHEIGMLKAIGIPDPDIIARYQRRYRLLALVGCIVGGALAVPATMGLTAQLTATYARTTPGVWTVVALLIALAVVYLVVMLTSRGVLRHIRRINVVDALIHGRIDTHRPAVVELGRGLASADLRAGWRRYAVLPTVFSLITVLIAAPFAVLAVLSSPTFFTSAGVPQADLMAEVTSIRDVAAMRADPRLADVSAEAEVRLPTADGVLRTRVGDTSVRYATGRAPGGGYSARLPGELPEDHGKYFVYADVIDGGAVNEITGDYGAVSMSNYQDETMAFALGGVRVAAIVALVFALGVAGLVTWLFNNLQIARDRRCLGLVTVLGYSGRELVRLMVTKTTLPTALGVAAGLAVAAIGLMIMPYPFALGPLLLAAVAPLGTGVLASWLSSMPLLTPDRSQWLR